MYEKEECSSTTQRSFSRVNFLVLGLYTFWYGYVNEYVFFLWAMLIFIFGIAVAVRLLMATNKRKPSWGWTLKKCVG